MALKLNKWDRRFLDMAQFVASWSKDPSTKVGCVIASGNKVISIGFNGYPHGLADTDDPRELKYAKTIHAEVNAILHAKQDLTGCSIYITPLPPCSRCAAVIIQSGITKIYSRATDGDALNRWYKDFQLAASMTAEAGIQTYSEINPCPLK